LQYSQSERIPWLLHELRLQGHQIPYKLVLHQRAPLFSPPDLAKLHPMHAAPVVQVGDLTLAESGAIIEYIVDVYASGALKLRPGDSGYEKYIYWWHWANSNLQPVIMRCATLRHLNLPDDNPVKKSTLERLAIALGHLDKHLEQNVWLAGDVFTAADVMILFSLTTVRRFWGFDLSGYGAILEYLKRVGDREGYRESMKEADPEMDWQEAMQGPAPRPFLQVRPKV